MKSFFSLFLIAILFVSCKDSDEISSFRPENWSKRMIDISHKDSLAYGKTYLSIYAQIYSFSEHKKYNLYIKQRVGVFPWACGTENTPQGGARHTAVSNVTTPGGAT